MATSLFAPNPKIQIKLFKNQPCQLHRWPLLHVHPQLLPGTVSLKKIIAKAQFIEPDRVSLQLSNVKERLWEATPGPVKEFPWRKAADILLERFLVIGKMALRWSLLTLFISSCISDVLFSISRNQELMIPVGLLIGCLMTDFFKETLQEIFQASQEKGLNLPSVIISCFFVLVKFISVYFMARPQILLLHVANGGLLQVLWSHGYLLKTNDQQNAGT